MRLTGVVGILLVSLMAASPVQAAARDTGPNTSLDTALDWHTVDSGGGICLGGSYQLAGTTGQAEAGVMAADSYSLVGGFWGAQESVVTPPPDTTRYTYLPAILR